MRLTHLLFGLLFVASTVVQYNDPDGVLWGLWYASAAAACFLNRRYPLGAGFAAALLCIGSVAWATGIDSNGMSPITWGELFGDLRMKTLGVERWREFGGLSITATWMLVLAVDTLGRKAPAPVSPNPHPALA